MYKLFLELLQVTLGAREKLSNIPSPNEWDAIYEEAQRQAVAGIMVNGLDKLPAPQRPPQLLFAAMDRIIRADTDAKCRG